MTRPNRFALATALSALSMGLFLAAAGQGQGTLPAGDLAKLIAQDVKIIDAELSKTTFSAKGKKRVRMAAFMIAAYAQSTKDNAPAMATLRDQALKLVKAAEDGKSDEAKKLAATLALTIKADPAAKTAPVALEKHLELELLMRSFSSEKVGGFGLEKAIEDLVDAKDLSADELEKARLVGHRVGMIGKLAHLYEPESDKGKKTKKAWKELADDMQAAAGELAAAASAKKDVPKIANKLSGTCTKCHDVFR